MGCNCGKNKLPLSVRQEMRRKTKQVFAEIRQIWNESANKSSDKITINKKDLGFK